MQSSQIDELQLSGAITIDGETFSAEEILVFREAIQGTDAVSDLFISIDLKCELTVELIREGLAREVVNRVQKTRKDLGLRVTDRISIKANASDELARAIEQHREYIMKDTLALSLTLSAAQLPTSFEIDDELLSIEVMRSA